MSEQKDYLQQTTKREFVEPEISEPVDVLEATAFFQVIVPGPAPTGDPGNI